MFSVPVAFRDGPREEFFRKLVAALDGHVISCIQFVPGYFVRVTFRFLESLQSVFRSGIVVDGVCLPMSEADSTYRNVYVHHYPCEVPDSAVVDALANFGTIHSVERLRYKDSLIRTGSRLIKMSLEGAIPCKLFVSHFSCRVWYCDQLQVCSICEDPAHRAADCPLHGLCRKCRQPGHVERNCPSSAAPDLASADPAPSSVPTVAAPLATSVDASPAAASSDVLSAADSADLVSSGDNGEMDDDVLLVVMRKFSPQPVTSPFLLVVLVLVLVLGPVLFPCRLPLV